MFQRFTTSGTLVAGDMGFIAQGSILVPWRGELLQARIVPDPATVVGVAVVGCLAEQVGAGGMVATVLDGKPAQFLSYTPQGSPYELLKDTADWGRLYWWALGTEPAHIHITFDIAGISC